MSDTPFVLSREGQVAHMRFCRPHAANSMTPAFWEQFPIAVRDLDAGGEVRALVISGEGRHFCSGMDISAFGGSELRPETGPAAREAFVHTIRRLQDALTSVSKARFPVIAAIQGACIGGALDLVSACDLRFAAEDAYFRIEEINIGMMADVGSLQRLPYLLPDAVLRRAIRARVGRRIRLESRGGVEAQTERLRALIADSDRGSIAVDTDAGAVPAAWQTGKGHGSLAG